MLTAGSLKDRVTILAPVLERGEMFGEQTIAYVDVKPYGLRLTTERVL